MILIVYETYGSNNFHIVIVSSQTKIHVYVYLRCIECTQAWRRPTVRAETCSTEWVNKIKIKLGCYAWWLIIIIHKYSHATYSSEDLKAIYNANI
jgi:hypothetical protein